jgi:Rieske Fe-S protein
MTDTTASPRVDRRTVVAGALVVGAAGTTGAVLAQRALDRGPATPPAPAAAAGGEVLAPLAEVPRGGGVVLADRQLVLTRDGDDVVRCFSAVCTHQSCLVGSVSATSIDCPCHGSRFDPVTGDVLAGPASRPLPAVAVALAGSDVVTA